MAIRSYSDLGMLLPPIIIMAHDHSHALNTINACWVYHVENVSKLGLVLSITFIAIDGVACVELAHSSLADWKDIFIIHLIIINRKYPLFPLLSYFPWLCVWCLRWLYYHILSSITYISREHWDLVSLICVQSIDVQSMVFANDRMHYSHQVVFFCFADYTISLSS